MKRLWWIAVSLLLLVSLAYDAGQWQQQQQLKKLEAAYIRAIPPARLYQRHILPLLHQQADARSNRFYLAPQILDRDNRMAIKALAVLRNATGTRIEFPADPVLEDAYISLLSWDGVLLQEAPAYNGSLELKPGGSVLAFLRIPNNPVRAPAVQRALEKIQIESGDAPVLLSAEAYALPDASTELEKIAEQNAARNISQMLTDSISLVSNNLWITYHRLFAEQANDYQPLLRKAAAAEADFVDIPTGRGKFALKRYDLRGTPLDGATSDYQLLLDPRQLPASTAEWYLLVRHGQEIFEGEKTSLVSYRDKLHYQQDGQLLVQLSKRAPAGAANWLPIPAGRFEIVFVSYSPTVDRSQDDYHYLNETRAIP